MEQNSTENSTNKYSLSTLHGRYDVSSSVRYFGSAIHDRFATPLTDNNCMGFRVRYIEDKFDFSSRTPRRKDGCANIRKFKDEGTSDKFASSTPSPRGKYDVFLSFRGEDTRSKFSYYLYRAFLEKGLQTFRDDDEIGAGKRVMTELKEAIKESKFSVLVISENYASSSWCLNELVEILECSKTLGQNVYPVFYHVDPSDVRKQTGKFGEGISKAVSSNQENAERWKEALEEIAGLKGWVYPSQGYWTEHHFINELAGDISDKLKDAYPYPLEGLVGMTTRMDKILKLLDLGSDEPRMVGICGMGGLGKSTLATAVYDFICRKFDGFSFIENVRDLAYRSGLTAIQEKLLSDILKVKDFKVKSVKNGTDNLRKRVYHKKVLIVLDDVDDSTELENLIGELDWFSHGSRIIITTRDRHTLNQLHPEHVYEVPELDRYEAEELFKSKAFEKNEVTGEFEELIDRALKYGGGIPLALKVLGRFLSGLTLSQWKDALDRLAESPGDKVQKVLRISYDGLDRQEKEIFLDICCFFRGKYKDEVINLLASCGLNPVIGVEVLVRKYLVTILENNTVWMHGLLQKMAWTIVQEESTKVLRKRSRLWRHSDIKHVLTENKGTTKIEGICDNYPAKGAKELKLSPDVFVNMTNLRVLKICYTCPSIDLPNMLRYLHWHGYPLKCLPSKFQPEHLVELHLAHSLIEQLWDRKMVLPKLTVLDLSHSTRLTKCPDFTCFPNLEKLFLEGCTSLCNLGPSIINLKKLTILILKGCTRLKAIPDGIESPSLKILIFSGCFKLCKILERFRDLKQLSELHLDGTGIKEVPQSIGNSTDLSYLDLSRCENLKRIPRSIGHLKNLKKLLLMSCSNLNQLPEEVGHIDHLEILDVTNSGVRKFPSSVERLKNLQVLSLRNCAGFPSSSWHYFLTTLVLPSFSGFGSLTSLDLGYCFLKSIPESISCCSSLKELILTRNEFESLPTSIKGLNNLEKLWLLKCKKLQKLPELPPTVRYLMTSGCESLTTIFCPRLFKDARILCFSNCRKLIVNEEINCLMEYKFLLSQIKVNNHIEFRVYIGPQSEIPKWFTHQNAGASIKFKLPPQDLNSSNLLGFALCAVVSTKTKDCKIGVQISVGGNIQKDCWAFLFYQNLQDVFILYLPIQGFMVGSFYQGEKELEVCFATTDYNGKEWASMVDKVGEPAPEVKNCGACLIYEDDLRIIEEKEEERL